MIPRDSKLLRCFDRRYLGRILGPTIAGFVLAIVAAQFDRGSTPRIALTAGVSVAFGYIIAVTVLSIRKLDELSQRIHLVAIAISYAATAILATALGFLGKAGLPVGDWYLWVWPFMALVWGVGALVISRRYQ
jgi:hypothetical protein